MRRLKKEKESIGKRKNNEYGIKNNKKKTHYTLHYNE
jgi:hypothetical protein